MNKHFLLSCGILFLFIFSPHLNIEAKIVQCIQPNGTIEFSNQGCSKSNKKKTHKFSNKQNTFGHTNSSNKTKRRYAPFLRSEFVLLQNKLIHSGSLKEFEQHSQSIMSKIQIYLQDGKLKSAYDMIAATYVKLSKHLKNKQWQGLPISEHLLKTQALFEEILISQSITTNKKELSQIIKKALNTYQGNT